ncbi:hypothetical protein ASD02_32165 [Ensifer sp. Root1252]|jgi:hypothetical protein|nr:hypothetical protein ASD02_32165 [Ensifer sp. Root1252]KRC54241.1 hypothetical protein ASE32_22215 [Ensifer sp. Root231]KRD01575.1 hypothetical protein ASE47_21590 [Ensifer sp. Root258]
MWISLTIRGQGKTVIDFSKVLHVNEHRDGTVVAFSPTLPTKENITVSKTIVVQEPIAIIEKLLKAKSPRL